MASNRTITQSLIIDIQGKADSAVSALKQVESQMKQLSSNGQIFAGVDKEFSKLNNMMDQFKAKFGQGIETPKEFNAMQKDYTKIIEQMALINNGLEKIRQNSDGAFQFKAIDEQTKKIEEAKKSLDGYTQGLKEAQQQLRQNLTGLGFDDKRAKSLSTEITSEQQLISLLVDEWKARQQNVAELEKQVQKEREIEAARISGRDFVGGKSVQVVGAPHGHKGDQTATANDIITAQLKQALTSGQSLEQTMTEIRKQLQQSGIELNGWNSLTTKIESAFNDVEKTVGRTTSKLQDATAFRNLLGSENRSYTPATINTIRSFDANATPNLQNIEETNKKIIQLEQEVERLKKELDLVGKTENGFGDVNKKIDETKEKAKQAGEQMRKQFSIQQDLKDAGNYMTMWIKRTISLTGAWRQFTKIIRQTFTDVQKLDKAFASIAMVTDKTVSGLWNTYSQYSEIANKLGQTTESAIKASALFYQQGLDTAEALKLTEDTMKLATLAGSDFETATKQMTAALRGFHMEMDQGAHVTDVYSELAAHAAADVNGIAYAMSKTASIANNAGMSFETTAAFLTNMIETTQEAPENIGTAMKTIIARFTELKENVAETADSEFDDLSYNKVDEALKSVGISLKDAQGQFRNLDDVFLELSAKWDTLDRNTQRYIATTAAGSRQQSRFIAMMEDYDRTMELVSISQDSAGRSSKQFAKYQETVEYKLNQLKNSWEQFRTSLVNSDAFKKIIDGLNKVVGLANKIGPKVVVPIVALIGVIAKIIGSRIVGMATQLGTQFAESFISGVKSKAPEIESAGEEEGKEAEKGIKKEEAPMKQTGVQFVQSFVQGMRSQGATVKTTAENMGIDAKNTLKKGFANAASSAVWAFSAAFTSAFTASNPFAAMGNTLVALIPMLLNQLIPAITAAGTAAEAAQAAATAGISLIIAAVAVLVSGLINYISKVDLVGDAWEKTDKKIKQAAEDSRKTADELSEVAKTSKEAADNGEKLKNRYDELRKKVVKTEEEQEEYNSLIKEINETFPQIVSYYDEVTGELRIQDELWDSILAKQQRQARMDRNAAIASEQVASDLESEAQRRSIMKDTAGSWGIGAASVDSIMNGGRLSVSAMLKNSDIHKLAEAISNATNIGINELIDANGEATEKLENTLADQIEDSTSALRKELEGNKDLIAQISKADILRSNRSAIEMYENNTGRELTNGEKWLFESMQGYADRLNYENKKIGLTGALNAGADIQQKLVRKGNQKGTFLGTAAGVSDTIISLMTGGPLLTLSQNTGNELFSQKGVNSMALNAAQRKNFSFFKAQKNLTFGDMQGEFANQMARAFGVSGTNQITFSAFAEAAEKAFGEEVSEKYKEAIENNTFDEFIADVVAYKRIENQSETIKMIMDELQNSPELLEQYNNLFNAMQQDGATEAEISAYTSFMENNFKEKYGKTFDLSELIGITQAKYEDALKAAQEIYGNLEQDWSDTQLSVINTFAADLAASNAGETNGYAFANSFVHSAEEEGFNQNEISAMIQSVDWDNISLVNYESEKEKFIETMKVAMGDAFDQDKVDRMWEYFFGEAEKYNVVNLEITTEGQLQSVSDSVEAQMESYYEAFSGITGYISNQVENGFIDPLDKGKIKEAYKDLDLDMDDYFGTDAEGNITFLYEKLAEDTREQISNQDKLIQKAKDEYQAGIEKLEQDNATYKAIIAQVEAQGLLTREIYNSAEAEAKLQQIAGKNVNQGLINEIKTMAEASTNNKDLIDKLEKRISANKELITQGKELLENEEYWKNQVADSTAYLNGQNRLLNEAVKTGKEAAKSAQDDSNKIVEAQKKVIEAQKKLNEAMYGTDYHKNKVDPMYNYNNMLKEIQKQIDTTKKKMDKLADSDASDSLESYRKLLEQESSVYQAERKVYEQSIANYQKQLTSGISQKIAALNSKYSANMSTDISSYYRANPITGMLDIDFAKLNAAHLPDDISDMIESVIDEINKGNDKIREIDENMEKRQEELEDFEKKVLDGYVKVEDEVIKVLKDKYKEEIDANKEKNDAMADADKEYLDALQDAIEKQRKLRDQENKWNDLAKKERQASLMARDTSGANRVELNKLNEEINEDRQDLLDETVDNILDNLKDMYDLQKEQRDKQIELQEQELDEQKLIREATSIISSWTSPEDVTAWMIENNKEVADMSDAKLEQQIQDWENLYHSKNLYENYNGSALDAALQGDTELINQTFVETSEAQIAEADRMTNEVIQKTDDSIESAKNSLESAIKSLNEELNKQTEYLGQIADNTNSDTTSKTLGKYATYQDAANAIVSNKGTKGTKIVQRKDGSFDIIGQSNSYNGLKGNNSQSNNSQGNGQRPSGPQKRGIGDNKIFQDTALYKTALQYIGNGSGITDEYGKGALYDYIYNTLGNSPALTKGMHAAGIYNISDQYPEKTAYNRIVEAWISDNSSILADYARQGKYLKKDSNGIYRWYSNGLAHYASGGLVKHTGPAWVDGTPQKPEAFLSAKDTTRIGMLTNLLSSLPFFNSASSDSLSQNIGDTSIEVNINIESISSEVDMDNAIERMKTEIVNAARPQGSTVILRK